MCSFYIDKYQLLFTEISVTELYKVFILLELSQT